MRERQRQAKEAALAKRLRDPRRPLIQRMVNILYARVSRDPVYHLVEISKALGMVAVDIGLSRILAYRRVNGRYIRRTNRRKSLEKDSTWHI
jgi:hypothetical protein